MYRVILCGDRNWTGMDLERKIRLLLLQMPPGTEILHGACEGVDLTVDKVAREMGFVVKPFPADWQPGQRWRGPARNKRMLDKILECPNRAVYAFHQHIEDSRGTLNMMTQAKKKGVSVFLIS